MSKKILIADDAMFMRKMVSRALEELDVQIIEADCGKRALELFGQEKPNLTLLDITMPDISGIEVLEEIKKKKKSARVIMCSAIGQEAVIRNAMMIGAVDFIIKPFKKEELVEKVKKNLRR